MLNRLARNAAVQDWLLLALHAYLLARAIPTRAQADGEGVLYAALLFGLLVAMLLATRGELLGPTRARAALYRVGLMGFVFAGYSLMGALLPTLQLTLLDAQLLAVDETLFGKTLAAHFDSFVTTASVEWFAFFYFSYYWLLPIFGLHAMLRHEGKRLAELGTGVVIISAVAYCSYTLVPAIGPLGHHAI